MKTTIIRAVCGALRSPRRFADPHGRQRLHRPLRGPRDAVRRIAPNGTATFTTDRPIFDGDEDIAISVTGVAARRASPSRRSLPRPTTRCEPKAVGGNLRAQVHFPANAKGVYTLPSPACADGVVLHSQRHRHPRSAPRAPRRRAVSPSPVSTRAARPPVADGCRPPRRRFRRRQSVPSSVAGAPPTTDLLEPTKWGPSRTAPTSSFPARSVEDRRSGPMRPRR